MAFPAHRAGQREGNQQHDRQQRTARQKQLEHRQIPVEVQGFRRQPPRAKQPQEARPGKQVIGDFVQETERNHALIGIGAVPRRAHQVNPEYQRQQRARNQQPQRRVGDVFQLPELVISYHEFIINGQIGIQVIVSGNQGFRELLLLGFIAFVNTIMCANRLLVGVHAKPAAKCSAAYRNRNPTFRNQLILVGKLTALWHPQQLLQGQCAVILRFKEYPQVAVFRGILRAHLRKVLLTAQCPGLIIREIEQDFFHIVASAPRYLPTGAAVREAGRLFAIKPGVPAQRHPKQPRARGNRKHKQQQQRNQLDRQPIIPF